MRVLLNHRPTAEQLPIIRDPSPGCTLIRGAAGSGKTSTAIWRLKFVVNWWTARLEDGHVSGPIRVLVLTFNRTLRGYIEALAQSQVQGEGVHLEVSTFGHWAWDILHHPEVMPADARQRIIGEALGADFPWQPNFIVDEVDYVLGRYLPEDRERYLTDVRHGRGAPSLNPTQKRDVYDKIVVPYTELKRRQNVLDWNDLAVRLVQERHCEPYQVIVVDETQDFSANQVRALLNHAADESTVTFVLDGAQKIYPHGFLWPEIPVEIDPKRRHVLKQNHRNTKQIAAFCLGLVQGLKLPDDATVPDVDSCTRSGPKPVLLPRLFNRQMDYALPKIRDHIAAGESTAILHARGGGYFRYVRQQLESAGIPYVDIAGQSEWPPGDENVALSTMNSAKGLEFDHVYILGLNAELTPHGTEEGDDLLERYRRLVAMAAGRARCTVTVGYKPTQASDLIDYMDEETYEVVH